MTAVTFSCWESQQASEALLFSFPARHLDPAWRAGQENKNCIKILRVKHSHYNHCDSRHPQLRAWTDA
jgi:hypothetical protein